ncbi:hypothetical protein OF83DRAFT_1286449 [Amylostereum chailletii]|nr:hypothetical protein OF83DRAFT_1286449 [Amylostereum chailletii]
MRPNSKSPNSVHPAPHDSFVVHTFYRRPLYARPLVWFSLGAVASAMWIHHRHRDFLQADHAGNSYLAHCERAWGCQSQRRALEGAAYAGWRGDLGAEREGGAQQERTREWGWGWRNGWPERAAGYGEGRFGSRAGLAMADTRPFSPPPPPPPPPQTTPVVPPAPPVPAPLTHPGSSWDSSARDLRELGSPASEPVADISEATVDSMIASLQSLKARIAEKKAQQENQGTETVSPPPPTAPESPRRLV